MSSVPPLLSESPTVLPVHRRILAFAFIGWVFDFYDLMLLSFVIASTPIMQDLGLSKYDVSMVLGISLALTAVGGLCGGALADRYGRKPLLMYAILLYSAGMVIAACANGKALLLVARAVVGLGVGAEWGIAHALVGETVPPRVRARFGSYLQSGGVFGRILATLGGNFLAPWIGWRWAFALSALPAIVVAIIRRYMPESDAWLRARQEQSRQAGRPRSAIVEMVGPALRKVTVIAFTMTALNMAAFWFRAIWLPTYFHEVRGLSIANSSWLFFMDQAGSVVGYICFGFAADHFGRRPSYFVFSMLKALGLVFLTVGWNSIAHSHVLLAGMMLLIGFGEGNWGGIGPIINELFPTSIRATALGLIYNLSRGMQFVAPVLIAFIAVRFTWGAGIALAAPFAFLSGLTVLALPETKGIRLSSGTDVGARAKTVA